MESLDGAAGVHYAHRVELQRMPHEVNIRHRGEDWAGITNQKERKKLQNRLNKRVSRQRKRRAVYDGTSSDAVSSEAVSPDAVSPDAVSPSPCLPRDAAAVSLLGSAVSTFSHCLEEDVAQKRAVLERFAERALASYMTADPCADHHMKLIQLNTINGFTRNAAALGFDFDWLVCAAISPFGRDGQGRNRATASAASVPSNLAPTSMQLTTRHHPWLDLFPLPRMRDNLLIAVRALSPENEQRLFDNVMESGGGRNEWAGLVVWGEPWDPHSWEISVPFLQKWGWLLRGCPEIIASTNRWRSRRGEKPIAIPGFVQEEHEYDAGSM